MATYYIDPDNGNDAADGLSPTGDATNGPWASIQEFTNNARSAGDIAIVRRGMTDSYAATLTFTSSGDLDNPIILKSDYGDTWSDFVTCSETGTFTVGSKTVTFTGDVSAQISAGKHIYISGEDNELYSYEVKTVSTNTVTLYLPYKGENAGSGKTVIIMPPNTIWQSAAQTSYYLTMNGDNSWEIRGIDFKGNNSNGIFYGVADVYNVDLENCGFEGNGAGDYGIRMYKLDGLFQINVKKAHIKNCEAGAITSNTNYHTLSNQLSQFRDIYIESGGSGTGILISSDGGKSILYEDIEMYNLGIGFDFDSDSEFQKARGIIFDTVTTPIYMDQPFQRFLVEDYGGTTGDNRMFVYSGTATSPTEFIKKDTGVLRSGGADSSILVTPYGYIGHGLKEPLLQLPIYLTAAQKTVTIYFKSHTTTEWTASPTADELFIEIDYLGASSGAGRSRKRSSGAVDFTTDTDYDQSLAVTFTPGQAGLAYINLYYGKPKESGKTNKFYIDPKPVIS